MSLDKLRRLTEAALRFDGEIHDGGFLLDMQAREQLISVALPLLLPLAEALYKYGACQHRLKNIRRGGSDEPFPKCPCLALTRLEEALG